MNLKSIDVYMGLCLVNNPGFEAGCLWLLADEKAGKLCEFLTNNMVTNSQAKPNL